MRSSLRTAQLAIQAAAEDDAFGPFLARVISQAEDDASSALNGFDTIQPPSEAADDLRDEVEQIASDAIDLISDARVAIRRGDIDGLTALAEPITAAGDTLEQFGQDHHV